MLLHENGSLIFFSADSKSSLLNCVDFSMTDKISHSNTECAFNVKTLLVHDNDIMIDNSIVGSPTLILKLEERPFSFFIILLQSSYH